MTKGKPRDSGRTAFPIEPRAGRVLMSVPVPCGRVRFAVDVRDDNDVLYRVEVEDAFGMEEPVKFQGRSFQRADEVMWDTITRLRGEG